MTEVICNTSPLQYLHQLGRLELLPHLTGHVVVPTAVATELAEGHRLGVGVADPEELPWITLREPRSHAVLPLMTDLGPGETVVLAFALESADAVVILDDALARRHAERLGLRVPSGNVIRELREGGRRSKRLGDATQGNVPG